MTHERKPQPPRRSGDRIIDTAEGVLIALRRYGLNFAFFDLAQTAKKHGLTAVNLADALVTIAQHQRTDDCDQIAVRVARQTWGQLLDRNKSDPNAPLVNRLHHGVDHSVWRADDDDDDSEEVLG